MKPIKIFEFFMGDIFKEKTKSKIENFFKKIDVIISDMAADHW